MTKQEKKYLKDLHKKLFDEVKENEKDLERARESKTVIMDVELYDRIYSRSVTRWAAVNSICLDLGIQTI